MIFKVVVVCLWILTLPSVGYSITSQDITYEIENFQFEASEIEQTVASYQQIQKSYVQLHRERSNHSELMFLKYKMEIFNYWFSQKLIKNVEKLARSREQVEEIFDLLPFILKDDFARKIGIKSSKNSPEKFLEVKTLERTLWSLFDNWKNLSLATSYPIEGESAYFHGITFQTGDLIVGDTNTYSYELTTATRDTEETGNHSAIFVLMHVNGRSVPTVFDMHADGVRATPLSHYLNGRINTYLEVYRLDEKERRLLDKDWQSKIRAYFEKVVLKQRSYKFDFTARVENNDRNMLTCTELVEEAMRAGGIAPVTELTTTLPVAYEVITKFGTLSREYLTPADFVFDGRFKMVGYVDMLNIKTNILVKLESNVFSRVLKEQSINTNKVLKEINRKAKSIAKIRQPRSLLGKIIRSVSDLTILSFPTGEPNLIAFNLLFNEETENAVKLCSGEKKVIVGYRTTNKERGIPMREPIKGNDQCYDYFSPLLENLDPTFDVRNFLTNEENFQVMSRAMKSLLVYFNSADEDTSEE